MKKYLIVLISFLCLCLDTELYAQRRNPAKNADLAFGRKQYTEAVDRYRANGLASATKWVSVTDLLV